MASPSPADLLESARLAQARALAKLPTIYLDGDLSEEELDWPSDYHLDWELDLELEEEWKLPLDEEFCFSDEKSEAEAMAVQMYVKGQLTSRERRVVEARAMRDRTFAEEWGDLIGKRSWSEQDAQCQGQGQTSGKHL